MKKNKKWLATLLAAVMAFSSLTVAFTAFAASPEEIKALNDAIIAEETLTNETLGKVKALTADEKDQLSVEAYVKVHNKVYAASQEKTGIGKETDVINQIGAHSTAGALARELSVLLNGGGSVTVNKADGTTYTFQSVTGLAGYDYTNPVTVNDGENKVEVTADMQKQVATYIVTRYNEIAAYKGRAILIGEYMISALEGADKTAAVYCRLDLNNTLRVTNAAMALAAKIDATVTLPKAEDYNLQTAVDAAQSAANQLVVSQNAATLEEKFVAFEHAAIQDWLKAVAVNASMDQLVSKSYGAFLKVGEQMMTGSALLRAVNNEAKVVQGGKDAIVFNAKVPDCDGSFDAVKALSAEYGKLSKEAKEAFKSMSAYATYNDFLKNAGMDPSFEAEAKLEAYEAEKVERDLSAPLADVVYESILKKTPEIAGILQKLVLNLLQAAPGASLQEALYTNKNITVVAREWSKLMWPLLESVVTTAIAGNYTVDQFFGMTPGGEKGGLASGFIEKGTILADETCTAIGKALAPYTEWADVPDNFDWKVTDEASFIERLLDVTLGIFSSSLTAKFLIDFDSLFVGTYSETPDGGIDVTTVNPGIYDRVLIPLLQTLGVPDSEIMSQVEYIEYTKTRTKPGAWSFKMAGDYLIPALTPLFDHVLPKLWADPVNYLASVLPSLAYGLTDGLLLDGIIHTIDTGAIKIALGLANIELKDVIYPLFADAEGNVPESLSFDLIWSKLGGLLAGLGLNISADDIRTVAHLGKAEIVDTVQLSAKGGKTIKITADHGNVLNFLMNTMDDLLGMLGVDFAVHGEFVKTEAPSYPHNGKMTKDIVRTMIDGLDGLLEGLISIDALLKDSLYTQEMAANLVTALYPVLNDPSVTAVIGLLDISLKPSDLAKTLTEDKYNDLRAALTVDTDSWDDVGLVIKNGDAIYDIPSMGFKDGDQAGFIDCVAAVLRPLVTALADTGLITNTVVDGETTAYGLYETLIVPTFEALGITPATDSDTYTSNYKKLSAKADKGLANDYLVKTILAPVVSLLNDFAVAPAKTLMNLLPNLAYGLQYSPQIAFVGNLLNGAGGLDGILNGLIGGLIEGFELPPINLDALASSGKLEERSSKSKLHDTYTAVTPDSADAFVTVFYYLYDAVNHNNNLDLLKNMIAQQDGIDAGLSTMIDTILNDVFTAGKEEALCKLGSLLAAEVWACPDTTGENDKTPSTGDVAIPVAIFLGTMLVAGAAIVLLRKRKAEKN